MKDQSNLKSTNINLPPKMIDYSWEHNEKITNIAKRAFCNALPFIPDLHLEAHISHSTGIELAPFGVVSLPHLSDVFPDLHLLGDCEFKAVIHCLDGRSGYGLGASLNKLFQPSLLISCERVDLKFKGIKDPDGLLMELNRYISAEYHKAISYVENLITEYVDSHSGYKQVNRNILI